MRMKNFFTSLCLCALCVIMYSCGTSDKASSSVDALQGEWNVIVVNGQSIGSGDSEKEVFIGFDVKEKRMYGCAGCNNMFGSLDADANNGSISFGNVGSTRMMCADMKTEDMLLQAINGVARYEIDGNTLTLKSADGKEILKANRKK